MWGVMGSISVPVPPESKKNFFIICKENMLVQGGACVIAASNKCAYKDLHCR